MLIVQITPCNMRWVEFYIIKANPCHCNPTGTSQKWTDQSPRRKCRSSGGTNGGENQGCHGNCIHRCPARGKDVHGIKAWTRNEEQCRRTVWADQRTVSVMQSRCTDLKYSVMHLEFGIEYTPFNKSHATQVWSIIFLLSWICIHQVRYPWKACIFAFRLMPYLLGLFHWGVSRMSKLGAIISKRKSCKIDQIVWKMHAMSFFVLSFCERMHTYPLPIHCTEILRNKTSCWISNSGAIFGKKHLFFDIASNIIHLHTFVPGNYNK